MVLKVDVYNDGECWCARGVGVDILTCGETLDELIDHIKDAVACHHEDELKQSGSIDIQVTIETKVPGDNPPAAG